MDNNLALLKSPTNLPHHNGTMPRSGQSTFAAPKEGRPAKSTRHIRVGLLGAGYIADWHAKALGQIENVKLCAVCDRDLLRAQAVASRFGCPDAYGSIDELIANGELDAVHVLLPPELHFTAADKLLRAGIDVLMEKPMCIESSQCAQLADLAKATGRKLAVGHNFLFHDAYMRLREDIQAGKLGKLDHITINWSKELPQALWGPFDIWMLRQPGNIALEIGPHPICQLLDLLGGAPEKLEAVAENGRPLPSGVTFFRKWRIRASQGSLSADVMMSFVPGFSEYTITARGLIGTAVADLERNAYVLRRHSSNDIDIDRHSMLVDESKQWKQSAKAGLKKYFLSKFHLSRDGNMYGTTLRRVCEAFYDNTSGSVDPRVSPELGTQVIATCQKIAAAAGEFVAPSAPAHSSAPINPRVLLLGAAGFIGQELLRQLSATRPVRVLVRSPGKFPRSLLNENVEVVRGDLRNPADLDRALGGIDCVYHLARANVKTWADYVTDEIDVTRGIAERCLAAGVKSFIYTGTIDSYYAGKSGEVITEDTPLDPAIGKRNLYARAKAISEDLLIQMQKEHGLPLTIVRPGIVIGSGGGAFHWGVGMWRYNSICQFWGRGENALPLVLCTDVAAALVSMADRRDLAGKSFNLVSDASINSKQYIASLSESVGAAIQGRPTAIWRYYVEDMVKWVVKVAVRHHDRRMPSLRDWQSRTQLARFDCSRARKELGWAPVSDPALMLCKGVTVPATEQTL